MLERRCQCLVGMMAMISSLCAGQFVGPAEGPVAFRRDRVPLVVEEMVSLSKELVILASALKGDTAEQRRCAAQMIALALALDPGNADSRVILNDLGSGNAIQRGDGERVALAHKRIWRYVSWLESPDAGLDGRALANCLKDILTISDPSDTRAVIWRAGGERGAWNGWISPLVSYQPMVEPQISKTAETPKVAKQATSINLQTARLTVGGFGELEMKATKNAGQLDSDFSLVIGSENQSPTFEAVTRLVGRNLTSRHGKLPAGVILKISGAAVDAASSAKKPATVSAGIAILVDAAITGVEPDATVMGELDATGRIQTGSSFWSDLRALKSVSGRRLIVPEDAAEYLAAMLALEKPEFFLQHEVLSAADFPQMLALSAKSPPEPLAAALALFKEVRDRATPQSLRQYLANTFVRRRLAEVVQRAPAHISARLLDVQGAGKRPITLTRKVLIAEIRRVLDTVSWIAKTPIDSFTEEQKTAITSNYNAVSSEFETLVRYAEKDDRTLVSEAQDFAATVRALDRSRRARQEEFALITPFAAAHAALVRAEQVLKTKLAAANGEPAEVITPDP